MALTVSRARGPLTERFWGKVEAGPEPDSCWLWTAYISPKGYGYFQTGGRDTKPEPAHRVAWRLSSLPSLDGWYLRNRCGTRHCVRPSHHELKRFRS